MLYFFQHLSVTDVVIAGLEFYFTFCVLQTQQHKFVNWQCDMECRGDDFTAAVTLGNPDVLVGSGMFIFLKLQWRFCGIHCQFNT